ncbi:MAG: hypothetical protein ABW321_05325 [Polyangiales bacterium]
MTQSLHIHWSVLAVAASMIGSVCITGCRPPEDDVGPPATEAPDGAPVIGKLQLQERVIDLTIHAFSDAPDGVPETATAKVMADVDHADYRPVKNDPKDTGQPWQTLKGDVIERLRAYDATLYDTRAPRTPY